jgi:hypothetical protein
LIEIQETFEYKQNLKKVHAVEVMERKDAADLAFNKRQKKRED